MHILPTHHSPVVQIARSEHIGERVLAVDRDRNANAKVDASLVRTECAKLCANCVQIEVGASCGC